MKMSHVALAVVLLLAPALTAPAFAAQITLGSGTGGGVPNTGVTDPNLKVVEGPADSDFTDPNFAAAVATLTAGGGTSPFIVFNGAWAAPLAGTLYVNPQSGGAGEGSTGAYLATFTLPAFSSASIDLDFLSDNLLNGVVLNGTTLATPGGGFNSATHVDIDNSALFVTGLNRLIFRAVDVGGPAGFDFSATVTFTPAVDGVVPMPPSLGLLGGGLAALAGIGWTRRRNIG